MVYITFRMMYTVNSNYCQTQPFRTNLYNRNLVFLSGITAIFRCLCIKGEDLDFPSIVHFGTTLDGLLNTTAESSEWPHGLRRGFAAARLLGFWARTSPRAWICQAEIFESGYHSSGGILPSVVCLTVLVKP